MIRSALALASLEMLLLSCGSESALPAQDARLEARADMRTREASSQEAGRREAAPPDLRRDLRPPDLVPVPTCVDGTPAGSCSLSKPFRCTSALKLEHDCPTCGCPGFEVCNSTTKDCAPATTTLLATADSFVVEPAPTENHGTEITFKVGRAWNGLTDGFLDFDLSTVPIKATVDSASLQLEVVGWGGNAIPAEIVLVEVPWAEPQITWTNAPTTLATPVVKHSFKWGANTIDAKSLVVGWLKSPVLPHGFRIRVDASTQGSVTLGSRENGVAATRPRLVVTYR